MNCLMLLILPVMAANIYTVQKNNDGQKRVSIVITTFALLLILFLTPAVLMIILLFVLYRQIINLRLKFKHGKRYRGLLQGFDVVHTVDEISNSKTCILTIFEYKQGNSSKGFFETFAEEMTKLDKKCFSQTPKLQSRYLKCMGYTYMLKEDVNVKECVRKMPVIEAQCEELDDAELAQLLGKALLLDLPKDNTFYWDFLVGTQPIKNKCKDDNAKLYPVMFRNHHCISDGVSLLKLLVGVLADKLNAKVVSPVVYRDLSVFDDIVNGASKLSFDYFVESIWKGFKKILVGLYVLLLIPSSIFTNLFLKANDRNFLHKQTLSGESILAFYFEENDDYFQKVKRIKQKIVGASFPEILLTVFSESLCNYFKKKTTVCPEYITSAIPVVPGSSELQHLMPGSVNLKDVDFQNNYSLVLLNLPLFIKQENVSLVRRQKILKKQIDVLSNSVDYQVMYILMNLIFSVLPTNVIRFFLRNFHCTTSASIVPGPVRATYFNGAFTMIETGFWIPHLKNIGVGFSVFTYDRRLFIGLSVDKALIDNYQETQSIVRDMLKNIDLFEKEVC